MPKMNKALVLANYSGLWDWDFAYVGLYEIDLTGLDGGAAVVEFPRVHCTAAETEALMAEMRKPEQDPSGAPKAHDYGLDQNHPNPFNPVTTISFTIPSSQNVSLKVYDVSGREVATLVNGPRPAGRHDVSFEAFNIASGIYFYRLRAGEYFATKKMIVVR